MSTAGSRPIVTFFIFRLQMGHFRFLIFYLIVGLAAAAIHILLNQNSPIPMVGASGAVSGVLGAYMLLYPRVQVHVFLPPFWLFRLSAGFVLGYWIVIQLVIGFGQLAAGVQSSGIAVWAHIGGFFAGLLLIKAFVRPELVGAKREGTRLDRQEIRSRRLWI